MKYFFITIVQISFLILSGCHFKQNAVGTVANPVKFYVVPSVDKQVLMQNTKILKDYLEKNTPYKFKFIIPKSFTAVVEAFATRKADIAVINTYGYYLAHSQFLVDARLTIIRNGSATYQSQFLARAKSDIKSLKDLNGKKVAFVDPGSASGYVLPLKLLQRQNIKPKQIIFAATHDAVVSLIYQGKVDAGATYYSPPQNGKLEDARRLLKNQYPDIEKKIKIIELSDPIPNDPIVFRKDLPEEIKEKIINILLQFATTADGQKALDLMFGATNFKKSSDDDYQTVLELSEELSEQSR